MIRISLVLFLPIVNYRFVSMSKKGNHQMKKICKPSSQPDLKTLGNQLLSSRAHVNNLPILLTFISPSSSPHHTLESLISLQSFFTPLLPDLPPSSSKPSLYPSLEEAKADPEFIYRTWLRLMFDEFVKLLIHFLISPESKESLKVRVLLSVVIIVLDAYFMLFVNQTGGANSLGCCAGYSDGVCEDWKCRKV